MDVYTGLPSTSSLREQHETSLTQQHILNNLTTDADFVFPRHLMVTPISAGITPGGGAVFSRCSAHSCCAAR